MQVIYEWKGGLDNHELEALHAEGFGHAPVDYDWRTQLRRHSLGWVCASQDGRLVGFVNVAWDGAAHAFILDTLVASTHRHKGIGRELVAIARAHAQEAGCEWLHADFEEHLRPFYFDRCGFTSIDAGVIRLR